ncbi:MAG: glycosyltransferase [Sphingobacteriales bacterium]|nr:glycosyltransferase [Sphingobacteriales bacterium]
MSGTSLPLVTVITPAYNQGEFLRDTIESVLSQNYPHIELYVLNDGSTDNTEAILKEYTGRIRWETQTNMGQTATINKGWRNTKGSIITWLNSDDTYLPGAVKAGVDYLLAHPETGIVFADSVFTDAAGNHLNRTRPVPPFDYLQFVTGCENPISQPSSFIRREVMEKAGELDPSFYYFMDWDFWLRAGLCTKIDHTDGVWSTYRLHAESKTVSQSKKAAPELIYMYGKYFSMGNIPAGIRKLEKKARMNMYFTCGSYYLTGEDFASAAKMARKALGVYPAGIFSRKALHKFLYCTFGERPLYKAIKKIAGRK